MTEDERHLEWARRKRELQTQHWASVLGNLGLATIAAGVLAPFFNLMFNQRRVIESYGDGAPFTVSLWIFCGAMLYVWSGHLLRRLP